MDKKLYIIATHTIPTEHPNAVRLVNLGLIFKAIGYDVTLIGFDTNETRVFDYKDIHCRVYNIPKSKGIIANLQRETIMKKYVSQFFETLDAPRVIVSSMYNCPLQRFLIQYSKHNNIKLIQSVCEWFDRSTFTGIKGLFQYINNRYSLYFQFPRIKNIIAISSLQANYYASRGCNTLVIPTLVDVDEYREINRSARADEKLVIAYAGSPAKKDYIANVIKAIDLLSEEERKKVELRLYGCTEEGLIGLGIKKEFLEGNRETIICHGRIPYSEVKSKIAGADFTVLLRPNMRYANAGFPTKVGESMACGTPVIANITSDLGKYLIDGANSIICDNETPEACAYAIKRAMTISSEEKEKMSVNARDTAGVGFNYITYESSLKDFLSR